MIWWYDFLKNRKFFLPGIQLKFQIEDHLFLTTIWIHDFWTIFNFNDCLKYEIIFDANFYGNLMFFFLFDVWNSNFVGAIYFKFQVFSMNYLSFDFDCNFPLLKISLLKAHYLKFHFLVVIYSKLQFLISFSEYYELFSGGNSFKIRIFER